MKAELWATWATAAGTFAAAAAAVGIALWRYRAHGRVERGERRARASLVLITEADHQSVTIENMASTPVRNLRLTKVESMLWEEGGMGVAAAGWQPPRYEVLAPHERKKFTLVSWRDDYDGEALFPPYTKEGQPHTERYPRIPLDELRARGAQLAVLPDEPYRFTSDDRPEAFPGLPAALVSGRHLTWYGPSLAEAPAELGAALRRATRQV